MIEQQYVGQSRKVAEEIREAVYQLGIGLEKAREIGLRVSIEVKDLDFCGALTFSQHSKIEVRKVSREMCY